MTEKFHCDLNGGILVTAALRYALGRQSYVPDAVRTWIACNWTDLDEQTQHVVFTDVMDYLFYESKASDAYMKISHIDRSAWRDFFSRLLLSSPMETRMRVYTDASRDQDKVEFLKQLAGPIFEERTKTA